MVFFAHIPRLPPCSARLIGARHGVVNETTLQERPTFFDFAQDEGRVCAASSGRCPTLLFLIPSGALRRSAQSKDEGAGCNCNGAVRMDLHLTGKKALVTGASRGIGFAVAKCLIAEGAAVRIAARPGERIEKAAASLRAAGAKDFDAYGLDLSLAEKRTELAARCGDVDILVNCAGVIPRATI